MSLSKNKLLTVFDKTTNSYKYYWWLSILKLLEKSRKKKLTFNEIGVEMLVTVWYPVVYYKISLGKQDQLSNLVLFLQDWYALPDEIKEEDLREFFLERVSAGDPEITKVINTIMRYVPYRFIRPWFSNLNGVKDTAINATIINTQINLKEKAPYVINAQAKTIELDENWFNWINENSVFIESFTIYKLFEYVEKNNPIMPNVSLKLFKPQTRNLTAPTKLWKSFIASNPSNFFSVFEKKPLFKIEQLSIDHFLPWSYLTHDQLWNLHPVEKSINSTKGNKIPDNKYVGDFCHLQYYFVHFLIDNNTNQLQDYNALLALSNSDLKQLELQKFNQLLKSKVQTEYQFAMNRGFSAGWVY